jgi:hypothetical protein
MALAQSTPPSLLCWTLPPAIRSFFAPAQHRLSLQMPSLLSPVVSDSPSHTTQLPVLSAANPVGLVYPAPPDTRAFLPTFGPDADRFLHGEALVNRVYTPYPREFYRDISPDVETFHPSFLTYDRITRIGTALWIDGDFSLPDCPSFGADFNAYMPVYFKPGDRVYLKTRDFVGAGHVERMVHHTSDTCTYLVSGYCYERMEPANRTSWFHVLVHAIVAMPRHMPLCLARDHWYLTSDREMPANNSRFYGMAIATIIILLLTLFRMVSRAL